MEIFPVQSKHKIATMSKEFQDLWLNKVIVGILQLVLLQNCVNLKDVLFALVFVINNFIFALEALDGLHEQD